ncbi:MAG: ATP synthase F1 subunit delta [Candidatus Zixiibacteriota bacterium]|nr:MAG: ATP synthase F1 subunit delta [candidate division Zixibacteria bacterium]
MNINKIGVRYAKALIALSVEKNIEDKVITDIRLINGLMHEEHRMEDFFKNPTVKMSDKIKFFQSVFQNNIDELTMKFLVMVINKGRELFLKDIFRNTIDFYRELKKIKEVTLITTNDIDSEIKENIINLMKNYFSKNYTIDIHHKVDEEQIGGFLLEVDNKQLDMTVKYQIETIKRDLINTTFQVKL